MSFELGFVDDAWKEWCVLDGSVRAQFKSKLTERWSHPRVPSARRSGHGDPYKIKLRTAGYRLVYEVRAHALIVLVVAIGKRERNAVYKAAAGR